MTLDEIQNLIEQLGTDAAQATDEQLDTALTAIREQVAEVREAEPSEDAIAVLTRLRDAKVAVETEMTGRATAKAETDRQAAELLAELDAEPEAPAADEAKAEDDTPTDETPAEPVTENEDNVAEQPELIAASAVSDAIEKGFAALAAKFTAAEKPAEQPKGRSGRPGAHTNQAPAPAPASVVTAKTYVGTDENGRPAENTYTVAQAVHERFRGAYQAPNFSGRMPVIHVESQYPEDRVLGSDAETNFSKIEKATSPAALTAAGGLCAPLETLYDVEVVGSAARPVRDSLARFAVERGGIQFRPNTSAAAAVYGAGVWTLDDDEADPLGEKSCYVVDCPGLEEEVIEATYICLEFSNITARFDPETTASHVQQAGIAHARLAENRLLAKMASRSKLLSAPKVVGATRDILGNLDRASAYLRNRHRIDDTLNLTMVLPGWVKSLMRADISRQMAAGDWMDALALADNQIDAWFSRRNVSPVWHLDGPAGTDEVQTVTITGTPTGGTFTLTYDGQTTAAIAYNATAATVKSALAALNNIKAEDITVAGGPGPGTPYTVTFGGGAADGHNVSQMTATGSLSGGSTPAVAVTTTTGGGGALTVNGVSIASQTYGDAPAGSVLPGFPDQIDALLFTTGSFLYLDGGSLDLGLVRDSTLNSRNRYRLFQEEFSGAAFRGIESLRLAMTVQPTGQASGTKDLDSIVD